MNELLIKKQIEIMKRSLSPEQRIEVIIQLLPKNEEFRGRAEWLEACRKLSEGLAP